MNLPPNARQWRRTQMQELIKAVHQRGRLNSNEAAELLNISRQRANNLLLELHQCGALKRQRAAQMPKSKYYNYIPANWREPPPPAETIVQRLLKTIQEGSYTSAELSARLNIRPDSITPQLKRLHNKGLVLRQRQPNGRYCYQINPEHKPASPPAERRQANQELTDELHRRRELIKKHGRLPIVF